MDISNNHSPKTTKDKMKFEADIDTQFKNYKEPRCDGIDCAWCGDADCRRWVHD